MGECCNISRAHCTVSASNSASGTTVLIRPISRASWASYWRQRNQISRAFFCPTWRASKPDPKPPSKEPTIGPVCPNFALSAAMVRSQTTWSTWPPPITQPATMATTGLGVRRICICKSRTLSRPTPFLESLSSPRYPSFPRIRISPPEQKASSPAPVKMITPTESSSRAILKASASSKRVWGRNALCTSGRLIVIFAMPSATS